MDLGTTSRRGALKGAGVAASAGLLGAVAPQAKAQNVMRPAPQPDLVNVLEYEEQARRVLPAATAALITGSDRTVTDRITLRPRMVIPTRDLDLTHTLLGDAHFAPIIVGPVADQRRFHAEAETATARGASAAHAAMVVSARPSLPLATIAQSAATPLYVEIDPRDSRLRDRLTEAEAARVRAVFVTVGSARPDWRSVEAVARATSLPLVVKGVMRPADAREAVARGAKAVVVSNWREGVQTPGTLLMIQPVAEAVEGKAAVLADGGFRRGTDVLKALAFGADGVLVARPAMWGLAAYGAAGVQGVVEMLQSELARYMAMCGCPTLEAIQPGLALVHPPISAEARHV